MLEFQICKSIGFGISHKMELIQDKQDIVENRSELMNFKETFQQ